MRIHQSRQKKRLSLLLAALLLFANALVTVHAFGEASHAVADSCELLHQFERQQHTPVDVSAIAFETAPDPAPVHLARTAHVVETFPCFHSRAPPLA